MTFKCNKTTDEYNKQSILYQVNSIGVNPRSDIFVFTAGGDGIINYWDFLSKNKIKSFSFKGVPITAAEISPDGMIMAYALGYDWSKGIWGINQGFKTKIAAHQITQSELSYLK